jgi:hypothetical protein
MNLDTARRHGWLVTPTWRGRFLLALPRHARVFLLELAPGARPVPLRRPAAG